ncbi:hypothetical protein [Streptomyces sp. NPDC048496]|uniref:hypothetical protein n=1 Tax=Streptomyces sp. NPDC048496 TaxID=3365558 RepID=UPI00371A3DB9
MSVEGAGEIAAGFGEQVAVAEAATVVDRDQGGNFQGCGGDVNDGMGRVADYCGGEAGQAQQVVDGRLADPQRFPRSQPIASCPPRASRTVPVM